MIYVISLNNLIAIIQIVSFFCVSKPKGVNSVFYSWTLKESLKCKLLISNCIKKIKKIQLLQFE